MSDESGVMDAARRRADALAAGDSAVLELVLHPAFVWSTHTGQRFDRAAYVSRNTDGTTSWRDQELRDPVVTVVGDAAVLVATVDDTVVEAGADVVHRMPITMTWVRTAAGGPWRCLAGHAGPRLSQ